MSIDFAKPAGTSITVHPEPQAPRPVPNFQKATREVSGEEVWGPDGFGFDDFIDMINPLQHIPIVSSIYRAITGDEIAPGARMVGGALLGGVVGMVASAANVMVEQATGGDIGENVMALFSGDDISGATTAATALARTAHTVSQNQPYTLPSASARQVLPSASSPDKSDEDEQAVLESLDFSALKVPAALPSLEDEEEQLTPSEAILDLFSAKSAGVYERYQQAQANEYMTQVARDMKV